ncbi:MAG: hypothetical protein ABJA71_00915 [Ginsengibacter sp.]
MSDIKWLQKQEHFDWMQKCLICWKMCEEFISESIQDRKHLGSINICRDITELCSQCIKFEAQASPFFQDLCEVCAEVCETCSGELNKYENEGNLISKTIYACNELAIACRNVPLRPAISL